MRKKCNNFLRLIYIYIYIHSVGRSHQRNQIKKKRKGLYAFSRNVQFAAVSMVSLFLEKREFHCNLRTAQHTMSSLLWWWHNSSLSAGLPNRGFSIILGHQLGNGYQCKKRVLWSAHIYDFDFDGVFAQGIRNVRSLWHPTWCVTFTIKWGWRVVVSCVCELILLFHVIWRIKSN